MGRSLQRHLTLVLGGAVLLAGLVATIASFYFAYSEANELQDDMLHQIAILSVGGSNNTAASVSQLQALNTDAISDQESRVTVIHLPADTRPSWLDKDIPSGFHTLDNNFEQLRLFVRDGKSGERTVVYQTTDARDEIAIDSALRTLVPLLLLLPILGGLIVRIVRSELAPISVLAKNLDEQSADSPVPLASESLPLEIIPFVDAINRLLARVHHLMGQQRRFIADAAHELRSPLTALSVQAQNLQQAATLQAMHERAIPLQAGIERARQLTEQLLDLARTQAGTSNETDVNISMLARELIAEFLPFAESKHIDLGLEEITPLSLHASPEALRLILKNALENALKYTPVGGEVTLRLLSDNDEAIIEVVDNGPGIPVAEREHVFDAFYRMTDTRSEGSGLGLAIVREAAIRTGGTVSLHERLDASGLIFRYRLER